MRVGRLRSGIILIVLGVLLLLSTLDYINWDFWWSLSHFWPVLLIAIGIEKIFTATDRYKPLAFLSPVLILGTVAYVAFAGGNDWDWRRNIESDTSDMFDSETYSWTTVGTPDNERIRIVLEKAGGRVVVRNGTGDENLVEGRLRYWGRQPEVDWRNDGAEVLVHVKDHEHDVNKRDLWLLKIADRLPADVKVSGGATRMRLDFTGIRLEKLDLEAGASEIDIVFGTLSGMVDCALSCGAAAVDLTIPAVAGISIRKDEVLTRFSAVGLELIDKGGILESPDFELQPVRLRIDLESGVSTLNIHRTNSGDAESSI
ncbi:MAG TPA: DUF5668 domain-containing protein [candidate division Zixibacteria bacterium]|jgi:hypothetical protein